MSPEACKILTDEVMPILSVTIPCLRLVGSDDIEEVRQDAIVGAAQMLDACERNGKPLLGRSTAFYALRRAKSGRRSTSANRTDVLSPATVLDGNSVVMSLDEPMGVQDEDDGLTFGEMLVSRTDDPCTIAGRSLDWSEIMTDLDGCNNDILVKTAEGRSGSELAQKWGISNARITQRKHEIAEVLTDKWGGNVLRDVQCQPQWVADLRVCRERAVRTA